MSAPLPSAERLLPSIDDGMSRRRLLALGALGALGLPLASGCGRLTGQTSGSGSLVFLSTQFVPVEEAQRFRQVLAAVHDADVEYVPSEAAAFNDRITSQVEAGSARISVAGGLHGDLAPLTGELTDLSDLMADLQGRGFSESLTSLATLGTDRTYYIPWMQATYILCAHRSALDHLPAGADHSQLTYDQFLDWAAALAKHTGKPAFGLPAGPEGLLHRFLQGFTYPSFTGAAVTKFTSPEAVTMWGYLSDLWKVTAPASTNFDYMQEPLASGEVLLAWDHVARLVEAPKRKPGEFVMMPVPAGPAGRGYMPVVAGLAIPKGAPDPDGAEELIRALTEPKTQLDVLRKNAFFPTVDVDVPGSIGPGVSEQVGASRAQQELGDALVALPPTGLGERDAEMSQVFRDCFTEIVLDGANPASVLPDKAGQMQEILDAVKAPCWAPDPDSGGQTCQVG